MSRLSWDLSGKAIVITGGNSGIGLGFARGIAKAGGDVVIWGRRRQANSTVRGELEQYGTRVLARANAHLKAGEPLKALHLAEAVEATERDNHGAASVMLAANRMILEQAGRENFSEVRWLESEIIRLSAMAGESS